jgi:hypothetical protein
LGVGVIELYDNCATVDLKDDPPDQNEYAKISLSKSQVFKSNFQPKAVFLFSIQSFQKKNIKGKQ